MNDRINLAHLRDNIPEHEEDGYVEIPVNTILAFLDTAEAALELYDYVYGPNFASDEEADAPIRRLRATLDRYTLGNPTP